MAVEQGGAIVETVRVEVNQPITDARLSRTPSLEGAITFSESTVEEIAPGTYEKSIGVGAPSDAVIGSVVAGTVHLRSGARTLAQPLPVRIRVIAPDPTAAEQRLLFPSADRVLDTPAGRVVRDEILVGVDPDDADPVATARRIAERHDAELIGAERVTETFQLQVEAVDSLEALQTIWERIGDDEEVQVAAPRVFTELSAVRLPDDPRWDDWDEDDPSGNNWHLEAIRAPSAWALETGSADVTVAVIDADFDPEHEDLTFTAIHGERVRSEGHGTRVAGIVCADGDNGIGISGVSWECDLRGYEIGAGDNEVDMVAGKAAMVQAVQEGARVVNLSWTYPGWSPTLCALAEHPDVQNIAEVWRRMLARGVGQAGSFNALWVAGAGNAVGRSLFPAPSFVNLHIEVIEMGKRGPKPAPTNQKVLQGVRPSRINRNEPAAPTAEEPPDPPSWLSGRAKAMWRRLAPTLFEAGVLTEWDTDAFAVLCSAYGTYREAQQQVDRDGSTVVNARGAMVKHPACQVARDSWNTFAQAAARFGMTPSDRQQLKVQLPTYRASAPSRPSARDRLRPVDPALDPSRLLSDESAFD